ncbi:MAG: primosomal protein N' [Rickettsiales bacterium]|nr:primosomal protein N' [Rickettsiales bacterium]
MNSAPSSKHSRSVQVLLPLLMDAPFEYHVPEPVEVTLGSYVMVPLGKSNKEILGVVWSLEGSQVSPQKVKSIVRVADHIPPMRDTMRQFLEWVAWYGCASRGMVLKLALSKAGLFSEGKKEAVFTAAPLSDGHALKVTPQRQRVLDALRDQTLTAEALLQTSQVSRSVITAMVKAGLLEQHERPAQAIIARRAPPQVLELTTEQSSVAAQLVGRVGGGFHVTLLDGVTGSGKTEVYFEAVEAALALGKQVLVLLPEIALSVQWIARFERRFGMAPQVWHSGIAEGARARTWRGVATGEVQLIVGARSALFLPYADLGLIVVDEEHDASYKQEDGVIYQGRDMAVVRARHENIPMILASATPSLESLINAKEGKYALVELRQRHHQQALPSVQPIDMRTEALPAQHWVSETLKQAMAQTLAAGHQTLLFLNRRGYAPLLLCRTCGHRFACPQCSSWLVWHKQKHTLQCHHCGYQEPSPQRCPSCHDTEHLAACGPGIERLQEEVLEIFPQARLLTLSSETMKSPRDISHAISQIEQGAVDIIIGTQLLAKGHHFPGLALVGIVDGDLGLAGGDLRACERTWQLLHQLAGRAGRADVKGRVLLQTFQPQHPVMQALVRGDKEGFLAMETLSRRQLGLPPYGRLAALIIDSTNEQAAQRAAQILARTAPSVAGVQVLGPAPAPLYKLRNRYRHRLLVQAPKTTALQSLLMAWVQAASLPANVSVRIDVDPYSFL